MLLFVVYFLLSVGVHVAYVSGIRLRVTLIDIWMYMFSVFAISYCLSRVGLFPRLTKRMFDGDSL